MVGQPIGRPLGRIGIVPALLLVTAAIDLGVMLAAQAATSSAWLLEPRVLLGHLTSASTFLLAAAVLLGGGRWPRARPWLVAGALALATHGMLDLGLNAWNWWAFAGGSDRILQLDQTVAFVRGIAQLLAAAAAPALLAVGLYAAPPTSVGHRTRRAATWGLAVLGLVALAGNILLSREVVALSPLPWFDGAYYALTGLRFAAFGALGAIAAHRLPAHYRMPELLIGAGAALVVADAAWAAVVTLAYLYNEFANPFVGWLLSLPSAIGLLGMMAIVLGFAVGRIVPARTARPPERAW